MTSDFILLIQELHFELNEQALIQLCQNLLRLIERQPYWLTERWRSYLTHLCYIPRNDAFSTQRTSSTLTENTLVHLLCYLWLITPINHRPHHKELSIWSAQYYDLTLNLHFEHRYAAFERHLMSTLNLFFDD